MPASMGDTIRLTNRKPTGLVLQWATGYAGVAQSAERQPSKLNVAGSNPVSCSRGPRYPGEQRVAMPRHG